MQEQEFVRLLQAIDCNNLDKHTQIMFIIEMTVLCYLLNGSLKQLTNNTCTNIFSLYEQSKSNTKGWIELNKEEFDFIFSNVTFYAPSLNKEIRNYIYRIFDFCNKHINTLSINYTLDIFSYIFETYHPQKEKHYTPKEITELMTHIIQEKQDGSFLDPACGSGEFISEAIKTLKDISGSEKSIDRLKISKMKALVNEISPSNITSTYFDAENTSERKFDFILSNPPFSLRMPSTTKNKFCIYGEPPASYADFAFLQYCIYKLKDNGRAAIILPDGVLFRSGKEHDIRKKIIDNNHITAIIYLPKGVFKNTAVATNILFLSKKSDNSDIFILDIRDKTNFDNQEVSKLFISRKATPISRYISRKEIADNNYNLSASLYFRHEVKEQSLALLINKQKALEERLLSLQHVFQSKLTKLMK